MTWQWVWVVGIIASAVVILAVTYIETKNNNSNNTEE